MNATPDTSGLHPILGCAVEVSAALSRVSSSAPIFMTAADKKAALLALDAEESRLTELRLRVLAAADVEKIGDEVGATSTAAYVAHGTRQTREQVAADVRFAASLDRDHNLTREALAAGVVNVAQARVIIASIDKLSGDVSSEDRVRAEKHMIETAGIYDAKALRILGRRLFEVIDPDKADEEEGKALERQEREARKNAKFSMRDNGDGTHTGFFKLPDLHAAMLKKALQAIIAPRRIGKARFDADGKKVPYSTLLGQGLMEFIERYPADRLPQTGGTDATVVVTMTLEQLLGGLGAATLCDGTRISAGVARRLACTAGIIPMVLGGDSMPLDLGQECRYFNKYQRIAMGYRDGGCVAEGCDRPAAWCEAHHDEPWAEGGDTDLENGSLRCSYHHVLAHDDSYVKTRLPHGKVRYCRRQ